MRPFDLEQLRSFVTILESGSLSAAAPKLCRSQSALSEQLRKLETFTGVTLLERGKKGVSPTPAGERLLAHARELLALSDCVLEDMRGVTLSGELRLAITDYFLPSAIAGMLKGLRTRYPQLRLHVSVRKSLQIEKGANSGEFDIGLSMRILDGRSLPEGIPVRREALRWVALSGFDAQHQLAAPLPLVVLPQDCSLQRFTIDLLDARGVPYVIAHSASGVAGLQSALLAGLGVACLNSSAVPAGAEACRSIQTLPALPDVEFSLLPPRPGEASLVSAVREMLITHFS
ncbi:LysR family transcriptional regulator [Pseudomonas sp. NPDC087814]|jgi:DNA-binding transcriptional LysR family regulator|uniref:LysR family transcriptional regulator n=1 Tax=Pseudomonas TaxID=286 RepID=UPI0007A45578|nr:MULTISPECIES: LysR family transcriptional regulator [Pseudomonas]AMW84739.1 Transcriptional regulator [Pseudomonas yamanorum]MBK5411578.1 LysR family transcriptional regulator [Pseudomonas sp. TH34]MBT1266546.1 LysR family transcriptional regulator [Pseudomonas sp. VS38]